MLRTADKRLELGESLSGVMPKIDWRDVVPPVSGYVAWFDAADEASVERNSSGVVGAWLDKSGNNVRAEQGVLAGSETSYGSRRIGNHFALEFDGTTDHLDSGLSSSDITSTSFFVALADDLGAFSTLRGSRGGTGGNQLRVDQTTGALTSNKEGVAGLGSQGNASVTAGAAFLAVQVLSATDCTHYLDGVSETDAHTQTLTGARTTHIGKNAGSTEWWDGLIGEVIVYDTTLSAGDVALVSAYLRAKWGTP